VTVNSYVNKPQYDRDRARALASRRVRRRRYPEKWQPKMNYAKVDPDIEDSPAICFPFGFKNRAERRQQDAENRRTRRRKTRLAHRRRRGLWS
jgi:hypothetical protein